MEGEALDGPLRTERPWFRRALYSRDTLACVVESSPPYVGDADILAAVDGVHTIVIPHGRHDGGYGGVRVHASPTTIPVGSGQNTFFLDTTISESDALAATKPDYTMEDGIRRFALYSTTSDQWEGKSCWRVVETAPLSPSLATECAVIAPSGDCDCPDSAMQYTIRNKAGCLRAAIVEDSLETAWQYVGMLWKPFKGHGLFDVRQPLAEETVDPDADVWTVIDAVISCVFEGLHIDLADALEDVAAKLVEYRPRRIADLLVFLSKEESQLILEALLAYSLLTPECGDQAEIAYDALKA